MEPKCNFRKAAECEVELKRFGGLMFSPPSDDNMARKFNICIPCYKWLFREVLFKMPEFGGNQ